MYMHPCHLRHTHVTSSLHAPEAPLRSNALSAVATGVRVSWNTTTPRLKKHRP